jgi:hypothetical protein
MSTAALTHGPWGRTSLPSDIPPHGAACISSSTHTHARSTHPTHTHSRSTHPRSNTHTHTHTHASRPPSIPCSSIHSHLLCSVLASVSVHVTAFLGGTHIEIHACCYRKILNPTSPVCSTWKATFTCKNALLIYYSNTSNGYGLIRVSDGSSSLKHMESLRSIYSDPSASGAIRDVAFFNLLRFMFMDVSDRTFVNYAEISGSCCRFYMSAFLPCEVESPCGEESWRAHVD